MTTRELISIAKPVIPPLAKLTAERENEPETAKL